VFNFYTDELGNRELPERFSQVAPSEPAKKSTTVKWALMIGAGVLIIAVSLFMVDRFRTIRLKSASAQAEQGPLSLPIPEKSIGVLPFKNLSAEKENAYFADGVQGEILTDLARVADLKVISQTSVMQYRSGVGAICARSARTGSCRPDPAKRSARIRAKGLYREASGPLGRVHTKPRARR
jgi:hypothetical protein